MRMRTTWIGGAFAVTGCGGGATPATAVDGSVDSAVVAPDGSSGSPESGAGADGSSVDSATYTTLYDAGTYALTSLDEPCEGGPTGRQALAFLDPSYVGTYTPPVMRPSGYPWEGPADAGLLTVTTSYDGGAIECSPAPPFHCCAGCPCSLPPPPSLTIAFNVGFRTADGTFRETLLAVGTYQPNIYELPWTATEPKADVSGTYPFSSGSTGLAFAGSFRNADTAGSINETQAPLADGGSASIAGGSWSGKPVDAGAD